MKSKKLLSIKYVADHTGLNPHLLRAWESRYNAVAPERTRSNRRLYCQEDVLRLKLLKLAVDAGYQISCIAGESTAALREIVSGTEGGDLSAPTPSEQDHNFRTLASSRHEICLRAVMDLDMDQLTRVLSEAAVYLTRGKWIEDLISPLFKDIGELWSSGRLKMINERMASNCVRAIMWDMLRMAEVPSKAPKIVVGTPVGQRHELGALAAALAAAEAGWRPVYVGANLPAEELASAVAHFEARCIALSITHPGNELHLKPELLKLRRYIGPDRCILIGGFHREGGKTQLPRINAKQMETWRDVTRMLKALAIGE